jgi:hypothetical protein
LLSLDLSISDEDSYVFGLGLNYFNNEKLLAPYAKLQLIPFDKFIHPRFNLVFEGILGAIPNNKDWSYSGYGSIGLNLIYKLSNN